MIPIVTPAEMQAIDAAATEPLAELIARAAWHVAYHARNMLGGVYGRRVIVVAGPGNNGEDGRVAARLLSGWGMKVEIVPPSLGELPKCDLVIDAAFGTGMNRVHRAPSLIAPTPILAIDIPSGVDGLTGEVMGSALQSTRTVTFAALKPGLLLHPGAGLAGDVRQADIGLDTSAASAWLYTADDACKALPRRAIDDHKWKRSVVVVGGSPGMYGAPLLASQAALRSGAGMVWCGLPGQAAPGIASEIVFRSLPTQDWHPEVLGEADRFGALVVGCGLGRSREAADSTQALVETAEKPIVVDGDALHLLGDQPRLRANIVLTPHDGEFTALTGNRPRPDRFESARSLAEVTGATVLLKGPLTIAASPDGRCLAVNAGDERLATAGTGDVLAGVVGSLLAAGLDPLEAAALGAHLHGAAGSTQVPIGMVASDLLGGLSQVLSQLGEPSMSVV